MQTLSVTDFVVRLAVGLGCGALIGLERQWRARMAGLRTNALVAAGATLFVLYAVAAVDTSSTRVASYVVSGVGFLGGGGGAGRGRTPGVRAGRHRHRRRYPPAGPAAGAVDRPRPQLRRGRGAVA